MASQPAPVGHRGTSPAARYIIHAGRARQTHRADVVYASSVSASPPCPCQAGERPSVGEQCHGQVGVRPSQRAPGLRCQCGSYIQRDPEPPWPLHEGLEGALFRDPPGSEVQKGSLGFRQGQSVEGHPESCGCAGKSACVPQLPSPKGDGLALPGPPWTQGQGLALIPGVPERDKCPQSSLAPSPLSSGPMPLHCHGCDQPLRVSAASHPRPHLPPQTWLQAHPSWSTQQPQGHSSQEPQTAPSKFGWSLKNCDMPPLPHPRLGWTTALP